MKYDFDIEIDRRNTHAFKYEGMADMFGRNDLTPMWVADMDLPTAPFVLDALRRRLDHPVLGYTSAHDGYYRAITAWCGSRYGWTVDRESICFVPGVVAGIAVCLQALTEVGDKVLIQSPVYPPFRAVPEMNGRKVITSPLTADGRPDMDDFRAKVKGCKVFILCNPHNPRGIVWKESELQAIAAICADEGCVIISDEIHADLTLPPLRHRPLATVSEQAARNSVTLMAPSKAFNMPGCSASHIIVPDAGLRRRVFHTVEAFELGLGTFMSFEAVEAAYSHGEEWLGQMLGYVAGNIDETLAFLSEHCPKIRGIRPEASFLVWLDCREMGLDQEALCRFFADEAGLALNCGATFGPEGTGFMRLNVGLTRRRLREALGRLADAYRRAVG